MIKKSILLASILSFLLLGTAFKASTPGQDWKFYFGKNYLTVAVVLNNGVALLEVKKVYYTLWTVKEEQQIGNSKLREPLPNHLFLITISYTFVQNQEMFIV